MLLLGLLPSLTSSVPDRWMGLLRPPSFISKDHVKSYLAKINFPSTRLLSTKWLSPFRWLKKPESRLSLNPGYIPNYYGYYGAPVAYIRPETYKAHITGNPWVWPGHLSPVELSQHQHLIKAISGIPATSNSYSDQTDTGYLSSLRTRKCRSYKLYILDFVFWNVTYSDKHSFKLYISMWI